MTTNLHRVNFTDNANISGLSAKGEVISADASGDLATVGPGADGEALIFDSGETSGLNTADLGDGTFIGLSDTPGTYATTDTGTASTVLGGTAAAVKISEVALGTTTGASGAVAFGTSTVTMDNGIAVGTSASVTAARSVALGMSASCDTADSLTMSNLPMINNTSATAVTLTASTWPGTNAVVAMDIIDLEGAIATYTVDLPTNTRMLVDRIDVMKMEVAVTATTTSATYTLGVTGDEDAFVTTQTLLDTDAENAQYDRRSFSNLARTQATTSLVFDHTTAGSYTGAYTVRVLFEGKLIRDE